MAVSNEMFDFSKLRNAKSYVIYDPNQPPHSRQVSFKKVNPEENVVSLLQFGSKEFLRIEQKMLLELTSCPLGLVESPITMIGNKFEVCTVILYVYKEDEDDEVPQYVFGIFGPEKARKQMYGNIVYTIKETEQSSEYSAAEDNYKHLKVSVTDVYLESKMRKMKK